MFKDIDQICKKLISEFDLIPVDRKEKLQLISTYISRKFASNETPKLIVVCTHNSRRSHIGQLWLAVAAAYFQLPAVETFSGGTEATAFNTRAVNAIKNIGFQVNVSQEEEAEANNPIYQISWKSDMEPYVTFSKKYDSAPNPKTKFGAIMVCTEADQGCPVIAGSDFRLALPFEDPKAFDDTDLETEKYDERLNDIGREILYAMSEVR